MKHLLLILFLAPLLSLSRLSASGGAGYVFGEPDIPQLEAGIHAAYSLGRVSAVTGSVVFPYDDKFSSPVYRLGVRFILFRGESK